MLQYLLITLLPALAAGLVSCPDGWTLDSGNCYRLYTTRVFYQAAMEICSSAVPAPSTLVSISSAEEQSFLNTFTAGQTYTWIGLTDLATEGTFQWTDGTPLTYTNWTPNQPDNLNNSDCVFMLSDGTWDDGKCEWEANGTTPPKAFVCKTAATCALKGSLDRC